MTVGLLLARSTLTLLLLMLRIGRQRGLTHIGSKLLHLGGRDRGLMRGGSSCLLGLSSSHRSPCAIVGLNSFGRSRGQGLLLLLLGLRLLEMLLRSDGCCGSLRRFGC